MRTTCASVPGPNQGVVHFNLKISPVQPLTPLCRALEGRLGSERRLALKQAGFHGHFALRVAALRQPLSTLRMQQHQTLRIVRRKILKASHEHRKLRQRMLVCHGKSRGEAWISARFLGFLSQHLSRSSAKLTTERIKSSLIMPSLRQRSRLNPEPSKTSPLSIAHSHTYPFEASAGKRVFKS